MSKVKLKAELPISGYIAMIPVSKRVSSTKSRIRISAGRKLGTKSINIFWPMWMIESSSLPFLKITASPMAMHKRIFCVYTVYFFSPSAKISSLTRTKRPSYYCFPLSTAMSSTKVPILLLAILKPRTLDMRLFFRARTFKLNWDNTMLLHKFVVSCIRTQRWPNVPFLYIVSHSVLYQITFYILKIKQAFAQYMPIN